MFPVRAAALRMYSARMRWTISVPFLFFATGMRTCSPVATSPSQPLSERTYPLRCRKPSPALLSPPPPTFSSRLRTFPRFGTSWSSVPFAFDMSTGLLSQKSTLYSTMPLELRGASLMSVITSFSGSSGSTSPKATPLSVSYCPTAPNEAPPKATARELTWILVMRASAGSPTPARATGRKPMNAARTRRMVPPPLKKRVLSDTARARCTNSTSSANVRKDQADERPGRIDGHVLDLVTMTVAEYFDGLVQEGESDYAERDHRDGHSRQRPPPCEGEDRK